MTYRIEQESWTEDSGCDCCEGYEQVGYFVYDKNGMLVAVNGFPSLAAAYKLILELEGIDVEVKWEEE